MATAPDAGWADLDLRLPPHSPTWGSPGFRDDLAAWVGEQVGARVALEKVKLRPWATVWRADTGAGRFYAKQNCALQSSEAGVVDLLARLAPDRVVPVTAVDADRGLLLTPDQGPTLLETAADDDLDAWARVLAGAAALQRDLAPHSPALRDAGLVALHPADATAYVERRLAEAVALSADDPARLAPEARDAVAARLPVVRRWAEQVEALGLPSTLNHNDLHENNVFAVGDRLRFFDFADGVLGDPLGALMIPLMLLAGRLDAGPDDERLGRVVEPALEVWSDLAPLPELRAALAAALQLARLPRLESWIRCCASMTDDERADWASEIPRWIVSLTEDPPYGRLLP